MRLCVFMALLMLLLTFMGGCVSPGASEEDQAHITADSSQESVDMVEPQDHLEEDAGITETQAILGTPPSRGWTPFHDTFLPPFPDQEMFISAMNKAGLDWEIYEERQQQWAERTAEMGTSDSGQYFIRCPDSRVAAIVSMGIHRGTVNPGESIQFLNMASITFSIPNELNLDEFSQSQQRWPITIEDQARFWRLLGILLDEEDNFAEIAKLAKEEYEQFDFSSPYWNFFGGAVADIKYSVAFMSESMLIPGYPLVSMLINAEAIVVLE